MVGIRIFRASLCAFLMGMTFIPAFAQEKAAPTKPAAELQKELDGYLAERTALGKKLQDLQKQFNEANKAKDDKQIASIRQQYQKLVNDFQTNTVPKMLKAAWPLYLADGKNKEAENVTLGYLQDLFVRNRYQEAATEGEKLIKAGRKHPAILNFTGVSQFATHNFDRAGEVLAMAEAVAKEATKKQEASPEEIEGLNFFQELGARYVGEIENYKKYWAKEQEIRKAEDAAPADQRNPRILFKTNKGDIELELYENQAPNTVANFVSLVEAKKYDGIAFHRVIPNFMAQGGDPNTLDNDPSNDGMGGPGYHIACECYQKNARMHFAGTLSMAHAGRDTGGSQFFITHLPTSHLNPSERGGHTVFGRVVKGMDIAAALQIGDKILSAKVLSKRSHPYQPITMAGE